MKPTRKRSILAGIGIVLFAALLHLLWWAGHTAMLPVSFISGFLLFALILGLALFSARKKLPFLPLFRASIWMRIHKWAGMISVLIFLLHISYRWPRGILEWSLAALFLIVAVSGILGMILSKVLPRRMTESGESLVHERIPGYRRKILGEVHRIVVEAETTCDSTALPDFYLQHVEPWITAPAPWWLSLTGRKHRRPRDLLQELAARERYLSDREKHLAEGLREWIETKENLDYQDASQKLLKGWLFIHIPFTWSLILVSIVHMILIFSYGGSH